ncbi:hypothetical protein B9Q02_00750 [Candidatus Marsarchaeota G1 archaeon BE_D]|uniref:Uncharacterized protein n=1 Tax=Candidatus Marsarchaeota G1 archaeon BE_D TaxID=1978156 RepID=A0A2R6AK22_9ARCH|nr:MAG: hypothetical protein B9Q02_00750 [Candidatus Marsarchaeota G1 archaeon BE_D]
MKKSYADFCVSSSVIMNLNPYLYDLKFCLVKIDSVKQIENVESILEALNIGWKVRTSSFDVKDCVMERRDSKNMIARYKDITIIRANPFEKFKSYRNSWIEITPKTLKKCSQNPNYYRWFNHEIKKNLYRVILSSDTDPPPAIRDCIALLSILIDESYNTVDSIIRSNSLRLGELFFEV